MLDYLAHHGACIVGGILACLVVGFACLIWGAKLGANYLITGAEKMKEKLKTDRVNWG